MNEDTPEAVTSRKKVAPIVPYEKIVSKIILKKEPKRLTRTLA